jgi:hypothetical protein
LKHFRFKTGAGNTWEIELSIIPDNSSFKLILYQGQKTTGMEKCMIGRIGRLPTEKCFAESPDMTGWEKSLIDSGKYVAKN